MKVISWAMFIFCTTLAVHLVIWRVSLPKSGIKTLLKLFFGMLFMFVLLLWGLSLFWADFRQLAPDSFLEYLSVFLLVTSMALAYTITYSAVEAESPSITLVMMIAGSGRTGFLQKDLKGLLTDEVLVIPRIEELIDEKMIRLDGDKYRLTAKGSIFVSPFVLYRELMGLKKGG
ncbi:MAG: hypothetical protein V2A70_01855 [Candidatus Omnitrophota bacterium]